MNNIVKPVIFDYNTNEKIIKELCNEYSFLSSKTLTKTCLGRNINALSLGNQENSVLYVAGVHGCEWITSLTILLFVENLCHSIKHNHNISGVNIKRAFSQLGITIIPCLNPDGVEIAIKGEDGAMGMKKFIRSLNCEDYSRFNANAMGIDINHNFDAGWQISKKIEIENGINKPCSRQFGGDFPESEIETRAVTKLCRTQSFRQCLALHSQGEEIYWKYGNTEPAQSQLMAKILANSCNYKLIENDGLASHAGLKDWFIQTFNRPGFTMEIGRGKNPLDVTELYPIYRKIEEALTIFSLM